MLGTDAGSNRFALSENYRGNFAGRMIRTPRWKYFFYTTGEEFLYDLESDPGEETNLVHDPRNRALADELKQKASAGWVNRKRSIREVVGLTPDSAEPPAKTKGKRKASSPQPAPAAPR
jgi:arylsulfatase A-like enzyme